MLLFSKANCERTEPPLLPHMYQCVNGRRIPKLWMCDGEDDCKDNSDEMVRQCYTL